MMKKRILLIIFLVLIFNILGCESITQNSQPQTTVQDKSQNSDNIQDDLLNILNSEQEIKNSADSHLLYFF
jgi:uncharacterized protein YcfL